MCASSRLWTLSYCHHTTFVRLIADFLPFRSPSFSPSFPGLTRALRASIVSKREAHRGSKIWAWDRFQTPEPRNAVPLDFSDHDYDLPNETNAPAAYPYWPYMLSQLEGHQGPRVSANHNSRGFRQLSRIRGIGVSVQDVLRMIHEPKEMRREE